MRSETRPRWKGRAGRLEVWYATASEADGTGWWFHYERVCPTAGEAFSHGWTAVFPPQAEPVVERFGPVVTPDPAAHSDVLVEVGDCAMNDGAFRGTTGRLGWEVTLSSASPGLYTFPRWTWEREILPGCQVVDVPSADLRGKVTVDGASRDFAAHGARAHIFGHGNAAHWGWLHADLGDGDLVELVAAVPHLPASLSVPPRLFGRLRCGGVDLPRDPLRASFASAATLGLPQWSAKLRIGRTRRLHARVSLPPERCVQMEYPQPLGGSVFCTNTERADLHLAIESRRATGWRAEREWHLPGTAHAEVGASRPWGGVDVVPFPR